VTGGAALRSLVDGALVCVLERDSGRWREHWWEGTADAGEWGGALATGRANSRAFLDGERPWLGLVDLERGVFLLLSDFPFLFVR